MKLDEVLAIAEDAASKTTMNPIHDVNGNFIGNVKTWEPSKERLADIPKITQIPICWPDSPIKWLGVDQDPRSFSAEIVGTFTVPEWKENVSNIEMESSNCISVGSNSLDVTAGSTITVGSTSEAAGCRIWVSDGTGPGFTNDFGTSFGTVAVSNPFTRLWRDVPYEEKCAVLALSNHEYLTFKYLSDLVNEYNRVYTPIVLTFDVQNTVYGAEALALMSATNPFGTFAVADLTPKFYWNDITGALPYPGFIPLKTTQLDTIRSTGNHSWSGPNYILDDEGHEHESNPDETDTFRIRFKDGSEYECPEPGEDWELVSTDEFDWPSAYTDIVRDLGESTMIELKHPDYDYLDLDITDPYARCWIHDFAGRMEDEYPQVLWIKAWKRKPQVENKEPETYKKGPYEWL